MFISTQENEYFLYLSQKKLASLNDGIALIKLFYNEKDFNPSYIININWAIEKKLYNFSTPINPNEINQLLTRGDFAYMVCKVFNTKGGLVNLKLINRYHSFKKCINLGLLSAGRGQLDTFTGAELLDTFSYIDRYIKSNKININGNELKLDYTTEYLPEWRRKFYDELDEQKYTSKDNRLKRKEIRIKNKEERLRKKRERSKNKGKEKFIDKDNLSEPKE